MDELKQVDYSPFKYSEDDNPVQKWLNRKKVKPIVQEYTTINFNKYVTRIQFFFIKNKDRKLWLRSVRKSHNEFAEFISFREFNESIKKIILSLENEELETACKVLESMDEILISNLISEIL